VVTEVSRNVYVLSNVIRAAVSNALIQQMKSGIPQWNMELRRQKRSVASSEEPRESHEEAEYEDQRREAEQPW